MTDATLLTLVHDDHTIRSIARDQLNEGMEDVTDPVAVVTIVLGNDGDFALKSTSSSSICIWDVYSRVGWLVKRERKEIAG